MFVFVSMDLHECQGNFRQVKLSGVLTRLLSSQVFGPDGAEAQAAPRQVERMVAVRTKDLAAAKKEASALQLQLERVTKELAAVREDRARSAAQVRGARTPMAARECWNAHLP